MQPTDFTDLFPRHLDDGTPYMSPSQISTVRTCGQKYAFNYVDGLPQQIGYDMILGSAVHKGIECFIVEPSTGNMTFARDAARAYPRQAIRDLKAGERAADLDETTPEAMGDEAARLTDHLMGWYMEQGFGHALAAEERVIVRYKMTDDGNEFALFGIADAVVRYGSGLAVIDWKTAGKAPSMDRDTGKYQLQREHAHAVLCYADGLRQKAANEWQLPILKAGTVTVTKAKTAKVCAAWTEVNDRTLDWCRAVTFGAVRQVVAREFEPNPFGAGFLCSSKYCSYWTLCPGAPAALEEA